MHSHAGSLTPNQIDRALVWRYIFAGLCASLDSIGLARFAFTPLIPELIQAHWFSTSSVVYLGAANLAGYVCGALIGRPIAARIPNEHALRLMMVLITAAFFACAVPVSFAWYFGWRFLSGIAGGVVMVLVAATILPHVPPARKGAAGGAIFLGLGLGIAGSGTIIPLLLGLGLASTWIGLGVISAILTAASWFAWPSSKLERKAESARLHAAQRAQAYGNGPANANAHAHAHAGSAESTAHAGSPPRAMHFASGIKALYVQYALMAAACIPPMVFLVDFIARGLGMGTHLGSVFWAIYGLGAIAGPPLYGYLADRLGAGSAITLVSLIMAVLLGAMYIAGNLIVLGVLTALIGTFAPGIVPLALARVHELVAHNATRQNIAWSRASIISAAGMAVVAYAYSALFNATGGDHRLLFLTAAGLLVIAILIGFFIPGRPGAATVAHGAA